MAGTKITQEQAAPIERAQETERTRRVRGNSQGRLMRLCITSLAMLNEEAERQAERIMKGVSA